MCGRVFNVFIGGPEMKKHAIICILAMCLFSSVLFGRQAQSRPVEFKKISERLFEIRGGSGSQGGAYIGDNAVLVIDPGFPI